jgi:VIT1/CCC1 family predicted Fe2+/Mn2+ transporter
MTAPPPGPVEDRKRTVARYLSNYRDEVDGVAMYRMLAEAEDDPALKSLFLRIADSEQRHVALWERKLREAGADVPAARPSFRVRLIGWLARRFGTRAVSPIVTRLESQATTMYDDQPEAIEHGLPADERSHARLFLELGRTGARVETVDAIPRLEGRHRGNSGNAIRAGVLGVNDGLVSTLSLVMGVAGADPGRQIVFLTGVAGLLAGAISMALGEWISVRSSKESFQRQVAIEAEELAAIPEEEEAELALIYQAKGLSPEDAAATAKRILANRDTALETLTREELGMSAGEAGNEWVAAGTSFALFAGGGVLPVIPWLFIGGNVAIVVSALLAGLGLFGAGVGTSLFTGRGVVYSGFRMLVFGLAAAAVTFGIGSFIGVSAGI